MENSDLGVLNEKGYGKVVGRIKDMIIRGGENVYPREIEEVLHTHPGIQEAQVRIDVLIKRLFVVNSLHFHRLLEFPMHVWVKKSVPGFDANLKLL